MTEDFSITGIDDNDENPIGFRALSTTLVVCEKCGRKKPVSQEVNGKA